MRPIEIDDRVVIKSGFYMGYKGLVIDTTENTVLVKLDTFYNTNEWMNRCAVKRLKRKNNGHKCGSIQADLDTLNRSVARLCDCFDALAERLK